MRRSAVVSFFVLTGCYSYPPLDTPTPASGAKVEADLTGRGSLDLASQIGPGAMSLRGRVLETESDSLVLALTSVVGRNEQETFWGGEHVRVPLITVARVEQRKFALGKSILFGGAMIGGLLAAVKAFQTDGSGGGVSVGGGGPSPQ
jgi:hypothetical protein